MNRPIIIERRSASSHEGIERRTSYRLSYAVVRQAVGKWAATPETSATIDCPACGGHLAVKKAKTTNGNLTELTASCSTPFCVTFRE